MRVPSMLLYVKLCVVLSVAFSPMFVSAGGYPTTRTTKTTTKTTTTTTSTTTIITTTTSKTTTSDLLTSSTPSPSVSSTKTVVSSSSLTLKSTSSLVHSSDSSKSLTFTTLSATSTSKPLPSPTVTGDIIDIITDPITVGVLLDEFPNSTFSAAQNFFLNQNDSWWVDRARFQLGLTTINLVFRPLFTGDPTQGQLALPQAPSLNITFQGPASLSTINGHSLVTRTYVMNTAMICLKDTAQTSDPALATIGGNVAIPFTLPVDPQLTVQRMGYACMDEGGFPLGSLDSESVRTYFDTTCTSEIDSPFVPGTGCWQCHCSKTADLSCVDAIHTYVGGTDFNITYTRAPWSESKASYYERKNIYQVDPSASGANLIGKMEGVKHNFVSYRYFEDNSCESQECLSGFGWRRIINFDATHVNIGSKDVLIGNVTYTTDQQYTFNPEIQHYLYYWFNCKRNFFKFHCCSKLLNCFF